MATPTDIASFEQWVSESRRNGVNIVVVGETGHGKSTLINGLVREDVIPTGYRTRTGSVAQTEYEGRRGNVRIFDTPGFFATKTPIDSIVQEIATKTEGKIDLLVYCHAMQARITEQTKRGIGYIADILRLRHTRTPSFSWENVLYVFTRANQVESSMKEELEGQYKPRGQEGQEAELSIRVRSQFEEHYQRQRQAILKVTQQVIRERNQLANAEEIASDISVVSAGYRKAAIPGCDDWVTNLWREAYSIVDAAHCKKCGAHLTREEELEPSWVVKGEEIQLTAEELGRGGWAVVRVAKFRGLRVAAKCLHQQIVTNYNRRLFTREMNVAARIRHPNLLLFVGATIRGELIILTELMPTSLRAVLERVERQPLTPAQCLSISLDVATALNYLHLMRPNAIVHRDVSSANVLLEPTPNNSWRAKVSDYGSANFLQQLRTANPGNPVYCAPEASDPTRQSPKMDIFSFGVLLVEVYTATFPDPSDREDLIQSIGDDRVVRLIHQCTSEDMTRRPTASEVITQLPSVATMT